jgi:hypothetical protein
LAIWPDFIWQFGAFLFGNLAGFHLAIWLPLQKHTAKPCKNTQQNRAKTHSEFASD